MLPIRHHRSRLHQHNHLVVRGWIGSLFFLVAMFSMKLNQEENLVSVKAPQQSGFVVVTQKRFHVVPDPPRGGSKPLTQKHSNAFQPTRKLVIKMTVPDEPDKPRLEEMPIVMEARDLPPGLFNGHSSERIGWRPDGIGNHPVRPPREVKPTLSYEENPDEFIAVDEEPQIDMDALQRAVQYPELARRLQVEGKVLLKVTCPHL